MHRLNQNLSESTSLTQAVVQAMELLGLLRAELARILLLRCEDIAALAEGRELLTPDTPAWQQAQLFVTFYNRLYEQESGDGVRMRNWLRRVQPAWGNSAFYLMVDEGHLSQVLESLDEDKPRG